MTIIWFASNMSPSDELSIKGERRVFWRELLRNGHLIFLRLVDIASCSAIHVILL